MPSRPNFRIFQFLMLLTAGVYLGWWFAVRELDPVSFNPLASRLFVVLAILVCWGLSWTAWGKKKAEYLSYASYCLLTAHFFYLLNANAGNSFWVDGAFITLFAVIAGIFSNAFLLFYSAYWMLLSVVVYALHPGMWQHSILLSGFVTILIIGNFFLRGRLKMLDDLTESTLRFEKLFNSMSEGIALHDRGIILNANETLSRLFGYTHDELIGRDLRSLVARKQIPYIDTRLLSNVEEIFQVEGRSKVGNFFPIEVRNREFTFKEQKIYFASILDISSRMESESRKVALARAESQREAAEEALRLRDDFIAIASHELKTPLTPLKLRVQTVLKQLESGRINEHPKESFSQMLNEANWEIDRLARLVELFLDSTYITKGKLELAPMHFSLLKILSETVERYKEEAARAGVTINLELFVDHVVYWDKLRFEQIIGNLLRNAIAFGKKNPITVRVTKEDKRVKISIIDRGMGISQTDLGRIFGRFERGVSYRNFGGLGLGLFIVKELVAAHKGMIFVNSEEGTGSTFTIEMLENPFIT